MNYIYHIEDSSGPLDDNVQQATAMDGVCPKDTLAGNFGQSRQKVHSVYDFFFDYLLYIIYNLHIRK